MKFHYGLSPRSSSAAKPLRKKEIPPHFVPPWPRDRSVGKRLGMDRRDFEQQVALEIERRKRNGGYVDRAAKSEHRRLRKKAAKQAVDHMDEDDMAKMEAPKRNQETAIDCLFILNNLDPFARCILFQHYLFGWSYSEIAAALNISKAKVGREIQRAFEAIRRDFPDFVRRSA